MKLIVCLANYAQSAYSDRMHWGKIIVLLLVVQFSFCAKVLAQAQVTTQLVAVASEKINANPSDELKIALMEKELQDSKDFTQHILATVYFCLGTVIVVLFAMVGFGWFQNIRAYERDKENLRQALTNDLNEHLKKSVIDLEKNTTEEFRVFDGKVAKIFENLHQQIRDLELYSSSSIFQATHMGKTPLTDLQAFIGQIQRGIGKVNPMVLNNALSKIVEYFGDSKVVDSLHRTALLELVQRLPSESAGYAERLREVLARE